MHDLREVKKVAGHAGKAATLMAPALPVTAPDPKRCRVALVWAPSFSLTIKSIRDDTGLDIVNRRASEGKVRDRPTRSRHAAGRRMTTSQGGYSAWAFAAYPATLATGSNPTATVASLSACTRSG